MKIIKLNLIICFSVIILSKENYSTEITIMIKGKGQQLILSESKEANRNCTNFDILPNETYINGVLQNTFTNSININNTQNETNNITLKWKKKLTRCNSMFINLMNMTDIYFTKFDTSEVTDMSCMFYNCSGLTSINLSHFNTSLVTNMGHMFSDCASLKILNLSSFNTSLVTNMHHMIYQCFQLTSIYLKNLNTSKVTDMTGMFENSFSLQSLYLKNFDTSSVTSMYCMFHLCKGLTSLDLSNFNTSKVQDMGMMFRDCHSLTLLNIKYFKSSSGNFSENMFQNTTNIKFFCLNVTNSQFTNLNNNCSYFEYLEQNKKYIIKKDEWIDNCLMDDTFKFEYNKTCYEFCPRGTYNFTENKCKDLNCSYYYNYNLTECITTIPEGYYCNDSNHKTIDKCNIKCKNCSNDSVSIDLCISCNTINKYYPKIDDISNNYIECYNTNPEGYILVDNIYKPFNYNESGKDCQPIDFFNGLCLMNSDNMNSYSKDQMIGKIKNSIMNGTMDQLISNVLGGEKKDYIVEDDDLIYQITSTYNQNNSLYNNISTIILGECEKILKKEYNINDELALLIFKIDYFKKGSSIPIIGYEIYHPETKVKLDLNLCNNANISINIPVSINEDNLLKYEPNNKYYTDECVPSTTENGTDILLNDRQDEFNNNNMFLCEKNCTYNGYNNQKANCECDVKYQQIVISELVDENNIVTYNFTNKNDMITMKCYQTLFSKDGLIKNIGSYIMFFIIFLLITSALLFYKCGYYFLEENINEIMDKKKNINKKMNINETIDIKQNQKNDNEKEGKKISNNNKIKLFKNKKKLKKKKGNKRKPEAYDSNSISKIDLKFKSSLKGKNENKTNKISDILNLKESNNDFYNDFDLNSFSYNEAKKYDNRKLLSFYTSLIRTKQPIFFSFCPINDYNSRIIKIDIFFISISLYYFINSLFFNQSTIHKIYEDKGIYNFVYHISYIIYSFIISHTLNIIIRYVFLSERNLHQIKIETNLIKNYDIADKVLNRLVIKYICFFCIFIIIDIFIWYYLSSFGAVYQNTQVYIIENTLISFAFSLIFPFFYYLLPSILRIFSLKKSNGELLYKISKIIQII